MVAFCDLIEERAVKAAKEYGVPGAKVYTDYQELLKDREHRRGARSARPTACHADISIDALHAGKHVMCEKPMAKSAADARRMVAAAKESGKKLTIGYQHRHKAETQYVKAGHRARRPGRYVLRQGICDSPPRHAELGRVPQRVRAGRRSPDRHRHPLAWT